MNYDFSDKEFAFMGEIQALAQDLGAADMESKEVEKNVRSVLGKLAGTPYLKLGLGKDDDLGLVALMGAMEILGAAAPSMLLAVESSTRVMGKIVAEYGDDTQKAALFSGLCDGKTIGAVALSETAMNIENDALTTEGKKEGDQVVINGAKQYVVNAPVADKIAVVGMMDEKPVVFVVDKATAGLTVEDPLTLVGYDGAAVAGLRLENCTIPATNVVGPIALAKVRMWENQVIIGAALGLMKAAYEAARDYAKEHQSGGKPVIAYQEVGFKLAEMLTMFQTAQLLAFRTAWTAEKTPKEADSLTLCTKIFATESAEKVAGAAMQIMAGAGYQVGNPAERSFRCAKYLQIAGTSTEISRVKIGDEALGYN